MSSAGPDSAALRVGIVGCGFATRSRHLPALQRMSQVRVVALADLDATVVSEVGKDAGIERLYGSASELVEDPDVEAIAVCVPASAHVDVAIAAIDAGKHVLVEKPLALSLDEADRLLERTASSSVKVTVGFNLRSHRLVRQALALVRGGAIGAVEAIRTAYSDPILERADLPPWRSRRAAGGGALFEKAVHHFDLWRLLLGDEVEEVFAFGHSDLGDDQTVAVVARTRAGTVAEALVSDRTATTNELTLYGQKGALHVNLYQSDGIRLAGPHDLPGAPRTRVRQMIAAARQIGGNLGEIRQGGVFDATYRSEWEAFAAAIRSDEEPDPSVEDGRRALEIVLASGRSLSTGESIRLADLPSSAPANAVA
ncbi:MAG: Gfo/Idh/MocA family protein [Gaiellaceae bacterium]